MSDDAAISDLYRKIDREKALIQAAQHMRGATSNPTTNSRIDSSIREYQRNIKYFEQTLQQLQARRTGGDGQGMGNGGPRPPTHDGREGMSSRAMPGGADNPYDQPSDYGTPDGRGYMDGGGHGLMPPRAPFDRPNGGNVPQRARPNYSRLGIFDEVESQC